VPRPAASFPAGKKKEVATIDAALKTRRRVLNTGEATKYKIWTFLTSPDAHRIVQLPSSELRRLHTPHRVVVLLRPRRTPCLKTATISEGRHWHEAQRLQKKTAHSDDYTYVSRIPPSYQKTRVKRDLRNSDVVKKRQADGKSMTSGTAPSFETAESSKL